MIIEGKINEIKKKITGTTDSKTENVNKNKGMLVSIKPWSCISFEFFTLAKPLENLSLPDNGCYGDFANK